MRVIDFQTWSRREHFEFFSTFDHPHFNMCANVDLTMFYTFLKKNDLSFSAAVIYVITRAANAIPEFRQRIRAGTVVEHAIVNPSVTILVEGDLFSFCQLEYYEDFPAFADRATRMIAQVKEQPTLLDEPGQDDQLFMTAIPWVSFTSFMHPMHLHPADSIPRFAWGKYFQEGDSIKMPLSVQGHHAVMDGVHIAKLYTLVQEYLNQPEGVLVS